MPLSLPQSIEAFVRGFAFVRSRTHPYLVDKVGPLWWLHDGPRKSGDSRSDEWVASGVSAQKVHDVIRKHARGRFAISHVRPLDQPDAELRRQYKQLGYRLRTTEPMFLHRLKRISRVESTATIERVRDEAMDNALAKAARYHPITKEHLADPDAPHRQYVAILDGRIVGWVGSITVKVGRSRVGWCSNLNVLSKFRRRGIGRALMARLLRDDRSAGLTASVLLASHTGAKLYPLLGYEQIGELLLFSPMK